MTHKRYNRRLHVQPLENRSLPATFNYLAGTLTVVADENEQLFASPSNDGPIGYLRIVGVNSEFDSLIQNQPVSNLIVKMGANNNNLLSLNSGVFLSGNLTVYGAKQTTDLISQADIGKSLKFQAALGAGEDTVRISSQSTIGGSVSLNLGGGHNTVGLRGGSIGGNLFVGAGAGDDDVFLTDSGDLFVGGTATFNLGAGLNQFHSAGNGEFKVGANLTYIGGAGRDDFDMNTGTKTTLDVGGSMKVALGAATQSQNDLKIDEVDIGGSLTVYGGMNADFVGISTATTIGGSAYFNLGNHDNTVYLNSITVGGSLAYIGGIDNDYIDWDGFQVGKNVYANLMGCLSPVEQLVRFGTSTTSSNTVLGSMTVLGGGNIESVRLHRTTIGGALKIATGGGADEIAINDTSVAGATLIDMGAGGDLLDVDNQNADNAGPLNEICNFGSTFTVKCGDGDDTVHLSSQSGTYIKFGSKVFLYGGTGDDLFENTVFNQFSINGNFEDCEKDNGVPMA